MGLPIWRVPDERTTLQDAAKNGPPLDRVYQSRIRRRPSIHGLRNRTRATRDHHHPDPYPPRLTRSPPASQTARNSRRSRRGGVPPISILLESADSRAVPPPPPPPPVPESRNYYASNTASSSDEAQTASDPPTAADRRRAMTRREGSARPSSVLFGHEQALPLPSNTSQLHFTRSPEPVENQDGHQPDVEAAGRTNLPTPPLDRSTSNPGRFLHLPGSRAPPPPHPLANSWRPVPPLDGLGDRDRSPNPSDAWEVIRTTITPDATLPSADSSFASGAASQSFASNSNDTPPTEPEVISPDSSEYDSQSDSASGEPDDRCADDYDDAEMAMIDATEELAREMYFCEMERPRGRERIAAQERIRVEEGNRFAFDDETASVDIGFRLLEVALSSEEGRERIVSVQRRGHLDQDYRYSDFSRIVEMRRNDSRLWREREGMPSGEHARQTVSSSHASRPASPRWEFAPLHGTETSTAAPQAHPVSPPNPRSHNDISSSLLSEPELGEQDLDAMRRVVERLASRDDVPDEWWMSMGLNLSRARPRSVETGRESRAETDLSRVRGGRVGRSRDDERDRRPRL